MKKFYKVAASVVLSLALGSGFFISQSATTEAAGSCNLFANKPTRVDAATASSKGGRQNCSNNVDSVAVAMREKAWYGERRIASARATNVKNLSRTVKGEPTAGRDVFTRTSSSTGAQSESANLKW